MKHCPSCNIKVDSTLDYCPLCQNELESDTNENINGIRPYFPQYKTIKVLSLFYRIQLFVIISICIIVLAIDFLFGAHNDKHWSLVAVVWLAGIELLISPLVRRRTVPVYFLTDISIITTIASLITFNYLGGMKICTHYEIPILILFTLIFNFIASLIDKDGNALVFSMCNILVGVIPPVIMLIIYNNAPVLWKVCLIVSIISLIGLLVFMGTKVVNEVQKRLNI